MGVAELQEIQEDKIMARRTKHRFHFKTGRFKQRSRGKAMALDRCGLW